MLCVLHRDIKSSDVMMDGDFNAYLGDFGLARLVEHHKMQKNHDAGWNSGLHGAGNDPHRESNEGIRCLCFWDINTGSGVREDSL